jgi:glycosyltransferase involved in cell wall biosynthesis
MANRNLLCQLASCERQPRMLPSRSRLSVSSTSLRPLFAIIIPVHNDWVPLTLCLHSLAEQSAPPTFEVIVVDDGSSDDPPSEVRAYADRLPLKIVKQSHAGIPAARNHGIRVSTGSLLFFIDADSRLSANCMATLATAVSCLPAQNAFQLCLVGGGNGIVGRAEKLRLMALQNQLMQPNGTIRYLNTAGFAMRRSSIDIEKGLFDPTALRAEDTLLLAELIKRGELPLLLHDAVVQHDVHLSLMNNLRKDLRSSWLEGKTFEMIADQGIQIRMGLRERLSMLSFMWKASSDPSIGRAAWFALTLRQSLGRAISVIYPIFRRK